MKAVTLEPGKSGASRLEEVPEPDVRNGSVLVEAIGVSVCGTAASANRPDRHGLLRRKPRATGGRP